MIIASIKILVPDANQKRKVVLDSKGNIISELDKDKDKERNFS
jgi:hypothetical protein